MVIFSNWLGINLWVDGTYQNTERTTAEKMLLTISAVKETANVLTAAQASNCIDDRDDVESAGVGFGTKLTYDAFSLVATGFYGHGLVLEVNVQ